MHIKREDQIICSNDFIKLLDAGKLEDKEFASICNDEIISIEEFGIANTYDIDITGNHLYFANNILTHNSATGSQLDIGAVDNDSVSDSIGTVQTADFIMFLLQTPKMKEEKLITVKITKNRFTGRTDYWDMSIDFERMKFSDAIVNSTSMDEMEVKTEVAKYMIEDIKKIEKHDNAIKSGFDESTQIKEEIDVKTLLGL